MQGGITILLPYDGEPDAQPLDTTSAARSLCAQISRTGDQISRAAAARFAQLSEKLDQLAQRAQDGEPIQTELDTLEAEAAALRDLIEAEKRQLETLPKLDSSQEMRQGVPMPLDRVTKQIFERPPGNYRITRSAARSDIIAFLTMIADPDSETRLERLTAYDKRVLLAVGGLCENNRLQFSFAQLWAFMGGSGRLNARQREQMRHSLRKLAAIRIKCRIIAKKDRADLENESPLLLWESTSGVYKGQKVDAIEIAKKPRWLQIAEAMGQITAIPVNLFADGLSLTEQSISLTDYLTTQAAHMKRQKDFPRQMRLDSIAAAVGANIQNRAAKKAFCEKIETKLQHFTRTGFIKGYSRYAQGYKIDI